MDCVAVIDVAALDRDVTQAIMAAYADSTWATRNSQWKLFIEFCIEIGASPVPADILTVCRFLCYKAQTVKWRTITNYVSAINTLHLWHGVEKDFRKVFMIQLCLRGLKDRLGNASVKMEALSVSELQKIYDIMPKTVNNVVLWCILMLGFRTLLRKSNLVPTQGSAANKGHVLQREDIMFTDFGLVVTVSSSKTNRFRERTLNIPLHYVSNPCFCVVAMLKEHFQQFPATHDSPVFLMIKGGNQRPVLYDDLLKFIKERVTSIGLDSSRYGTHSMRRSGATFLNDIGVPLHEIQMLGDWQSLAVLLYLATSEEKKRDIQGLVVNKLI